MWKPVLPVAWLISMVGAAAAQQLILDDSLRGSTTGTQNGGSFSAAGWRVTNKNDSITWRIPTVPQGAVEFSVRGLRPNDDRPEGADKNEIFHMYDWTYNNADTVYDGYRNGPYKHFIRKTNVLDPARMDSMELVWVIAPNYVEPDTPILSWDPNSTYRFREEWGPDGAGNTEIRTYRDGVQVMTMSVPGPWNPGGHSVRIAASTRAPLYPDFGAPVDAVYSDVKVWSMAAAGAPLGPGNTSDNPNGDNESLNDKCSCSAGPARLSPWIALATLALAMVAGRRIRTERSVR
jgi:MYXO-CTERM domain-containing protein